MLSNKTNLEDLLEPYWSHDRRIRGENVKEIGGNVKMCSRVEGSCKHPSKEDLNIGQNTFLGNVWKWKGLEMKGIESNSRLRRKSCGEEIAFCQSEKDCL